METGHAIEKVKELTKSNVVLASVQGLLTLIPYAGGPISLILSEYRGRRNAERIFEALIELKEAIEELPNEKRTILSEDQVVEIVHNTLEEITLTSSEEKLLYLRNSLTKAFTRDEIAYSQKQFYLSTLRDLSLGEMELMREIYISHDPFDQTYPERGPSIGINALSLPEQSNVIRLPPQIEYKPDTGEALREVLQQRLGHLPAGTLEGLINALDAKGLSRISPNLEKRTVKIVTYPDMSQFVLRGPPTSGILLQSLGDTPSATPIEASRTKFGEDFIQYIQSKH